MRTCRKCQTTKPLTEFYSGRHTCKLCYREQTAAYKKANREAISMRERMRRLKVDLDRRISAHRTARVLDTTRVLLAKFATVDEFAECYREVCAEKGYDLEHPIVVEVLRSIGDGTV